MRSYLLNYKQPQIYAFFRVLGLLLPVIGVEFLMKLITNQSFYHPVWVMVKGAVFCLIWLIVTELIDIFLRRIKIKKTLLLSASLSLLLCCALMTNLALNPTINWLNLGEVFGILLFSTPLLCQLMRNEKTYED